MEIFSVFEENGAEKLGLRIYGLLRKYAPVGVDILCIGTDRATGDSLGPLVGSIAAKRLKHARLFGTIERPVHAVNIAETIRALDDKRLLIAVDASLGKAENVGFVTVGQGSVSPGLAVDKTLPEVGDLFITGVVAARPNRGMEGMLLQSTRLGVVMPMARLIARGLLFGVGMLATGYPLDSAMK